MCTREDIARASAGKARRNETTSESAEPDGGKRARTSLGRFSSSFSGEMQTIVARAESASETASDNHPKLRRMRVGSMTFDDSQVSQYFVFGQETRHDNVNHFCRIILRYNRGVKK